MRTLNIIEAYQALKNCRDWIQPTPITKSKIFPGLTYKLEFLHPTGSFKWRGAVNALISLNKKQDKKKDIVCASTGNHGLAVALMAKQLQYDIEVVVSELTPTNKVQALRDQGAQVILSGKSQDEAFETAQKIVAEKEGVLISQFDTPEVIVGHMTMAIELLMQIPEMKTLIIPLSGGGLLVGLGLVVKAIHPRCQIIGVSMERGAVMHHCLEQGRLSNLTEELTLADSLGGGVTEWTFTQTQKLITETILVTEKEIYQAIHDIFHCDGFKVEGAAAVGIAALQAKKIIASEKAVCILSGMNIDHFLHKQIINQEKVVIKKTIEGREKVLEVTPL